MGNLIHSFTVFREKENLVKESQFLFQQISCMNDTLKNAEDYEHYTALEFLLNQISLPVQALFIYARDTYQQELENEHKRI